MILITFAAITNRDDLGELVGKIRSYDGSIITRLALLLMVLTFTRTKNCVGRDGLS